MRKEISKYFKKSKTRNRTIVAIFLFFFFILINGILIYTFNFNNYYFYIVKKIVPYPAFVFGKKIVSISSYDDEVSINKKIYESAYRIDFSSSGEGEKNIENLRKNVKEEMLDKIIMENSLKEVGKKVSNNDINKAYEDIVRGVGSDKEVKDILKYSANIEEDDIKNMIYTNLLKEAVSKEILYSMKLSIISLKPDDAKKQEDWEKTEKKANTIVADIKGNNSSFDKYYILYNAKNDAVVQNSGKDYYTVEDLPVEFKSTFYSLEKGSVSELIKTSEAFYIIRADDKRGYYRGNLDSFLKEQKSKLRILSFIR